MVPEALLLAEENMKVTIKFECQNCEQGQEVKFETDLVPLREVLSGCSCGHVSGVLDIDFRRGKLREENKAPREP